MQQSRSVMDIGILNSSVVGKDFLVAKYHPNTDVFLDYRNRIDEMMLTKKYPDVFYKNEIKAIDEILRILNGDLSEKGG